MFYSSVGLLVTGVGWLVSSRVQKLFFIGDEELGPDFVTVVSSFGLSM